MTGTPWTSSRPSWWQPRRAKTWTGPRRRATTTSTALPRQPSSPAGLTLVEVVAGLALLSTLLVAVLTTQARVTRQWAHAQRRLEAVGAADRLVTGWWRDVERFPRRSAGRVPGGGGLAWRVMPVANPELNAMNVSVVRVEVFEDLRDGGGGGGGSGTRDTRGAVLASVEVVLDDERRRPGALARSGEP